MGMELFPAADDDQWSFICRKIDECDYYLVIVGGRYGSTDPKTGQSYTEKEYRYALEKNKPIIGFVHGKPGDIPAKDTDRDEEKAAALEEFRELVRNKLCNAWVTPAELAGVVAVSMVQLMSNQPGIGWVRADQVPEGTGPAEVLRLRNRIEQLETEASDRATEAPLGTEDLVQGDDKYRIPFTARFDLGGHVRYVTHYVQPTWSELLARLGPHMLTERSETLLEDVFVKYLAQSARPYAPTGSVGGATWERANVGLRNYDRSHFERVLMQLRALGVISHTARQMTEGGEATCWKLTPYGDTLMTRVLAMRRSGEVTE